MPMQRLRQLGSLLFTVLIALAMVSAPACKRPSKSKKLAEGVAFQELAAGEVEELGQWVAALVKGSEGEAPQALQRGQGIAYVALRDHGRLLGEAWGPEGKLDESLARAIEAAKIGAEGKTPDLVEIDLAHSFKSIDRPSLQEIHKYASNKHLGVRGLELGYGGHLERYAPTAMLARDIKFKHAAREFWKQAKVDEEGFADGGGTARYFEAQQLLVDLPEGSATKLLRGNIYVKPGEVTAQSTKATADLLVSWMFTHLHEDGRMTYMWLPSESAEKTNDNNMIRQWMATNALIKIAEARGGDQELWDRIAKNIDYNLEHFYSERGEHGMISRRGKVVKLGAVSLAAMAIINHPQRARWQQQEHALRRTVASMWSESGQFGCYYGRPVQPGDRNNCHNFYSGETLLLWAQLYRESHDPELLRRYLASARYYRDWHRDGRRPSFTPWHTQAHFILWEALRAEGEGGDAKGEGDDAEGETAGEAADTHEGEDPGAKPASEDAGLTPEGWPAPGSGSTPTPKVDLAELSSFVFEMNDWLIEWMEVWEESYYDDEKGRFYSRKRNYGVPHASSTGVYIEGMIDAYAMARELGDEDRRRRYAIALSRAVRSVMQLQFVDEIDMYYVVDRERTKGGLRTAVWRNEIRVDNVQHVLMGMLKMIARFEAKDYGTD